MSDWQAGDLALAVGVNRKDYPNGWYPSGINVRGKIYRVLRVTYGKQIGLELDGLPSPHPDNTWHSASFRKIRPDEREACEPEFVTLLKRSKRGVTAIAAAAERTGA